MEEQKKDLIKNFHKTLILTSDPEACITNLTLPSQMCIFKPCQSGTKQHI